MSNNYWDQWAEKRDERLQQQMKAAGVIVDEDTSGLRQFMLQIYTWMAFGLALTGVVATVTASSPALLSLIFNTPLKWFLFFGELGLVIWFGVSLHKGGSYVKLMTMFLVFAAVNGLTLSFIFIVYSLGSIAQAFFISAGMFGGMSLYGYVTKRDLTGVGNFARMGLMGLILALVVNMFMQSAAFDYMISLIGVGIFVALTAYDVQKLKNHYYYQSDNQQGLARIAIGGALMLYLDFINMFLFLLRILGGRR